MAAGFFPQFVYVDIYDKCARRRSDKERREFENILKRLIKNENGAFFKSLGE